MKLTTDRIAYSVVIAVIVAVLVMIGRCAIELTVRHGAF